MSFPISDILVSCPTEHLLPFLFWVQRHAVVHLLVASVVVAVVVVEHDGDVAGADDLVIAVS